MKDVTVLLLAGGQSTRYWPLQNKMTVEYLGQTFLEHQIKMLKQVGFSTIVVVVNQEISDRIIGEGIKIMIQKGEGMGAAILSAKEYITQRPLLILNADDIISNKLLNLVLQETKNNTNLLVGYKTDAYFPGGYLALEGKRITGVIEKPGMGNEPSNYTRLVCDYFKKGNELAEYLKKHAQNDPISAYEETITDMIKSGIIFEMIEYQDTWIPVKYPWHTLSATEYYLKTISKTNISKSANIHKSASLIGPIMIEDGVRVMEYAKLVGPLYVGAGSIIGNHTIVRYSMVGENSVIGFSSDVTRSYIGNDIWLHSNYVGDSVLNSNIGMGAGAVLANFRLDEGDVYSVVKGEKINTHRNKFGAILGEGVRIGVGACLMPGIKVGKNSVVGPGVLLQEDLSDNKRCFIKQEHTITDNSSSNVKNRDQFRKKI